MNIFYDGDTSDDNKVTIIESVIQFSDGNSISVTAHGADVAMALRDLASQVDKTLYHERHPEMMPPLIIDL